MIKAFPKIHALGTRYISSIFEDEVEITEKIDGSQFSWGRIDDEFYCRSKGKMIEPEACDKMFQEAVSYTHGLFTAGRLPNNIVFYSEYLRKPKHNTLNYNRTPQNFLALFGVYDIEFQVFYSNYSMLKDYANKLDIETVPLLYYGEVNTVEELKSNLDRESILGGPKIEGFVVKNYHKETWMGDQVYPIMAGKFVSEEFKEKHIKEWKKGGTPRNRWEDFKAQYSAKPRWEKAIQHRREDGELLEAPQDIGPLMKMIQEDIKEECKEEIMEFLWKEFSPELLRTALKGFPQWYKGRLLEQSIEI